MKNTFGNNISVTLFGESHGEMIGAVLDGLCAGVKIDYDLIKKEMDKRRPSGKISTQRREADEVRIVSGVMNGYSTGTPITVLIENTNTKSKDYSLLKDTPRPSHADYTAEIKYHGFQDYRGGGHFSGRLTAPLVAVGAILTSALADKGIYIGTHIKTLHGICDRDFSSLKDDVALLSDKLFPVLNNECEKAMTEEILRAKEMGDSVGGILESAVIGLDAGVGEPWFDSLESTLSHALFSIPGIKGVEFGLGFGFADKYGSEANDPFVITNEKICTKTNNNGGINGGISNGMPIIFRVAVRPTPSIFREQQTVSLSKMENTTLKIDGRHDPAIIHRARAVVDAVTAIAIADAVATAFGTSYLGG
ncbi:MAG: chorismate synthase [Clostridia bacterium]|nr:chorismate synthase [Clostridia bacterium]